MKRNLKSLAALVLVCVLVIATPAGLRSARGAVDLEGLCTLQVNRGGLEYTDLQEADDVVVDIYKIANAVEAPGADTYDYQVVAPFDALLSDVTLIDQDEGYWESVAQTALKTVHESEELTPAFRGVDTDDNVGRADMETGLYLVVARNRDPGSLNITDHIVPVEGTDGDLASLVRTDQYDYLFSPVLVSLPTKAPDAEGNVDPAADGDWLYELTATLKPERTQRFGALQIRKTLDRYMVGRPATFLFEIEAYMGEGRTVDDLVYSNVIGLSFESAGTLESEIIGKIPVGATVIVTEVYSGITNVYEVVGEDTFEITIGIENTVDDPAIVEFENDVDNPDNPNGGGSIENHFTYDGEDWEQVDQTWDK